MEGGEGGINWSYQSQQAFICSRLWESSFESASDWLGKLGLKITMIISFFLPGSDDISVPSHMLRVIVMGASEYGVLFVEKSNAHQILNGFFEALVTGNILETG